MSLTNEDLKSIKGIVDTAIDTKIDHAIDTKLKPIVNDAVEGVENVCIVALHQKFGLKSELLSNG